MAVVTELLATAPAGAARIEDLIQHGPAAPSGTRSAVRTGGRSSST
ncbi:hypothetical protein ACPC54_40220 [Kitasatospora sp. NPDC094028]